MLNPRLQSTLDDRLLIAPMNQKLFERSVAEDLMTNALAASLRVDLHPSEDVAKMTELALANDLGNAAMPIPSRTPVMLLILCEFSLAWFGRHGYHLVMVV